MEKIFVMEKSAYPKSETAIKRILSEHFHLPNAQIERGDHGKPYLVNGAAIPLFFSVSHTENRLFIAFSDENVGIDAESLSRNVDYMSIIKRFSVQERGEIFCNADFLKHWTAKECAVKWLGGSLAHDLYKLRFERGRLLYGEIELPARLTFLTIENFILSVCSERDFSKAESIFL